MNSLLNFAKHRYVFWVALSAATIYLSHHLYTKEWIDSALLMSRITFVFIVFASIKRLPLTWSFPAAILLGPVLDRFLDYLESPLMDAVRFFLGNVVNPQFILIGITLFLAIYILIRLLIARSLRYLFLAILLGANIGASFLFHYTQVDRFIYLENERMMKQANLLHANLIRTGFENMDKICGVYDLNCVYGSSKIPPKGIDEDFHGMFKQAVSSQEPAYRTMRKFDDTETDPTKASMYQIFMFNHYGKWFYFDDQKIITPYYFNARRNFSILYTLFSIVWMSISAFILYRHGGFIDRRVRIIR